jgi:hypothetical protein
VASRAEAAANDPRVDVAVRQIVVLDMVTKPFA